MQDPQNLLEIAVGCWVLGRVSKRGYGWRLGVCESGGYGMKGSRGNKDHSGKQMMVDGMGELMAKQILERLGVRKSTLSIMFFMEMVACFYVV